MLLGINMIFQAVISVSTSACRCLEASSHQDMKAEVSVCLLLGKQEENASLPKLSGTGRCWVKVTHGDPAMPCCFCGLISWILKRTINKIVKNPVKSWKNI